MGTIMYELSQMLSYLIIFPIAVLIFYLMTIILTKKNINNRNIGIYGLLMNLNNVDILKISLLIVFYISIIQSIIVSDASCYNLIFIAVPIIAFEIINKSYIKIFLDLIEFSFIFLIVIFKNVFFAYFTEVVFLWYVMLLYFVLCMFVLLFATYLVFESISTLLNKNGIKNRNINNSDEVLERA